MVSNNKIVPNTNTQTTERIKKLKKSTKSLLIESTFHGIPKIFKSKTIVFKLIWFISSIITTLFGLYLILKNIQDYLDYEVVTKIEVIDQSVMPFPTVHFYNLNQNFNYFLNETLVFCSFNNEPCTADDFLTHKTDRPYHYFNHNGLKKSYLAGQPNSLRVYLFTSLVSNPTRQTIYGNQDYRITIYNKSYRPENFYSGFTIQPEYETSLMIHKTVSSKLEKPYSECIKNVTEFDSVDPLLYNFIVKTRKNVYRKKDCLQYCISYIIIGKCNLTANLTDYYILYYDTKKSNDNENFNCLNKTYYEIINDDLDRYCGKYCPLECDSSEFHISTSISNLPESLNEEVMKNKQLKFSNQTITGFQVYFNELRYTKISELPKMKIFDLIANIGGIIGLSAGISFLSFIEVFELIFDVFRVLITNK